jgi:hypothetical protein
MSIWLTWVVANNFWGKDDAGVQPLLERMQNAKVTCDELKSFYNSQNPHFIHVSWTSMLTFDSSCFDRRRIRSKVDSAMSQTLGIIRSRQFTGFA